MMYGGIPVNAEHGHIQHMQQNQHMSTFFMPGPMNAGMPMYPDPHLVPAPALPPKPLPSTPATVRTGDHSVRTVSPQVTSTVSHTPVVENKTHSSPSFSHGSPTVTSLPPQPGFSQYYDEYSPATMYPPSYGVHDPGMAIAPALNTMVVTEDDRYAMMGPEPMNYGPMTYNAGTRFVDLRKLLCSVLW